LNLGDVLVAKSLAHYTGETVETIKQRAKESGDLSTAANFKPERPEPVTLASLWQHLHLLARTKGKGSVDAKMMHIHAMLCKMPDAVSFQYYIRVLQQNVRTGLAEKSVMSALAQAFSSKETVKQSQAMVERATSLNGSIDRLVSTLINQGLAGLAQYSIEPLCPVAPMLAKASKSIQEVFEMTNERNFVVEYKYDGERLSLHILNDRCESYSRSMERSTEKFADFVSELRPCFSAYSSLILDGEVIALDPETRTIQSF
jgi:DNA ligase-1